MMIITAALLCAMLPLADSFAPSQQISPLSQSLRRSKFDNSCKDGVSTSTARSEYGSSTRLSMAFETDKPSNMFDGPMALTKERDACGVGFIANTKSGGNFFFFWDIMFDVPPPLYIFILTSLFTVLCM
jgi:glutamate synthase (ferredoxin)